MDAPGYRVCCPLVRPLSQCHAFGVLGDQSLANTQGTGRSGTGLRVNTHTCWIEGTTGDGCCPWGVSRYTGMGRATGEAGSCRGMRSLPFWL